MVAETVKRLFDIGEAVDRLISPHELVRQYCLEAKDDFVFARTAGVYRKHKYDWLMPVIHNEFWPCRDGLLGLTQGELWL